MNEEQESAEAGVEPVVLEPSAADEEAARKRAREFDNAIYAALTCRAQSGQARALVEQVMQLVTEAEAAAGKRTNKRGKMLRSAGAIQRAEPLRHDASQPSLQAC